MSFQLPLRPLSALAGALATVFLVLAVAGCSHIAPLGQAPRPVNLPPSHELASPISVQVMHSQPATPTGQCPAASVSLFGFEPNVPRMAVASQSPVQIGAGSTAAPTLPAVPTTPPALPVGVACYIPVGTPVTITSAAVSPVATYQNQSGPATYGFVVAFPTADVTALTAAIRQAYGSGDSLGMSVGGKLWQAPQPKSKSTALRAEQIDLLSQAQAFQLYHLLIPSS
jgi:hypothetical protein